MVLIIVKIGYKMGLIIDWNKSTNHMRNKDPKRENHKQKKIEKLMPEGKTVKT